MADDQIKQGDTVMLKSGGPTMTVEWVDIGLNEAYCVWFVGNKNNGQKFATTSLKKVTPNSGPKITSIGH